MSKNFDKEIAENLKEKITSMITGSQNFVNASIDEIIKTLLKYKITDENKQKYEMIMDEKKQRYTALPIEFPQIWALYKGQEDAYWRTEEIDFSGDYKDLLTLNKNEQHFIKMIIAFFSQVDGIVNINIAERFIQEIKIYEITTAYDFQKVMENTHSQVYSRMLDELIKDPEEHKRMFNSIVTIPSIKLIADWAFKWIDSSDSIAHRLVAFAMIEGVIFSGAFAAIFWLKKYKTKNKQKSDSNSNNFMSGLMKSNEFISRDEGLHYRFACEVYKLVNNKLTQTEINIIVREGADIAKNFMTESIPVKLIGMSSEQMCNYIEYISDRLLYMMGYRKIYNKPNPFSWMKEIGYIAKTNFHESRPTEYGSANSSFNNKQKVIIEDDF